MIRRLKHRVCRALLLALAVFSPLFVLTSCQGDDGADADIATTNNTLLMYMPWTGDKNTLTSYFWTNISDMKKAYANSGVSGSQQVVVFISTSGTDGYMFNISDYRGHDSASLATYRHVTSPQLTTSNGIAAILSAMMSMAPARNYAMTIGCHGMGWLPPTSTTTVKKAASADEQFVPYWQYSGQDTPMTRYFGGTSAKYQTSTAALAEAIGLTGVTMDFILFDDCYMSSIEAAYDLRRVAGHIIACPTEVMGDGMPYATIGRYLFGTPDYNAVCQGFVSRYSNSGYPYGTIGVTDCKELDSLAAVMREINAVDTFATAYLDSLQRMDGYTPVMFYDYGDYVSRLCSDSTLLAKFNAQLDRAVPYKGHTGWFPTTMHPSGAVSVGLNLYKIKINAYSGITTSEPSVNSKAVDSYSSTAWYKATH